MPLHLYEVLPNVTAQSTTGELDVYDYFGDGWGVIFAHPADFTPVCTTELGEVSKLVPDFAGVNCKILACSCDPVSVHQEWKKDIETVSRCSLEFPIVDDSDRAVSRLWKMDYDKLGGEDGKPLTARVAYMINPLKEIVFISVMPWTVGRSFTDMLRTVKALQLTFKHPVATPAEWLPGDKVFLTDAGKLKPEYMHMSQSCVGLPSKREYITLVDDPDQARVCARAVAMEDSSTLLRGAELQQTSSAAAAGSGGTCTDIKEETESKGV